MKPKYKRVLLKISGEAMAGDQKFGISDEMTYKVAGQIKEVADLGVEIAIVVGGGLFGFIGMVVAGSYSDLKVWSGFALIVAGLNLIAILKRSRTE